MCKFSVAASPCAGITSVNDLREGRKVVGNKNNRKCKRCVRFCPAVLPAHNFIDRAESIVPEVNKANEIAGQNVFFAAKKYLTLFLQL